MSLPDSTDKGRGIVVPKQKWDVYNSLLLVAFVAVLVSILCLVLEMSRYGFDMKAAGA